MKPTANSNYLCIVEMKSDIKWIKNTIWGVFVAIVLNIIVSLIKVS